MEIGSAYALQVCLLQIPAMVAFSAFYDPQKFGEMIDTFTYVVESRIQTTDEPDLILFDGQAYFPSMGCNCDHPVDLLAHIHLHRGKKQLPQRKHPSPCVSDKLRIFRDKAEVGCSYHSYLVLTAGFYFSPTSDAAEDTIPLSMNPYNPTAAFHAVKYALFSN